MSERRALAWVAFAAVAVIAWLAQPFTTGLLLGALMGFALRPANERLARRTGRPHLAAVGVMSAATVIIVGVLAGFVTIFITRAVALANTVSEQLAPGGAITRWLDAASQRLGSFGVPTESLPERLRAMAGAVAARSAVIAAALASSTFGLFLGLLFALLAMYAVLRYWPRMIVAVTRISPLRPDYTRALLEEFERVGRTTLSGTVFTGLAQGALAAVGYWITGVPDSLFFGFATALASLVPAVGTLLVWVPAAVYLFATGHTAMAIAELLWGALVVVGVSDYVIRPKLVAESGTPALLTFVALFGGLEVMGLPGVIVGPIVMALAIAVLRLYVREDQASRAAAESVK